MAKLSHNRTLGLSARSIQEIEHAEEVFRRAHHREQLAFHQQAVHKKGRSHDPKATVDIALATSGSGKAAYGAVVTSSGSTVELSGPPATTEHRTALLAAEACLRALQPRHDVTVHVASDYLVENIGEGRVQQWQRCGWVTKAGKPVQSRDLWERILRHCARHQVVFQYPPIASSYSMCRAEELAANALNAEPEGVSAM